MSIDQRALLVTFSFPPSVSAGVHRILRFTRFLPDAGWRVAVLASSPDEEGQTDPELAQTIPPDVEVSRHPLCRPEETLKAKLGMRAQGSKNGIAYGNRDKPRTVQQDLSKGILSNPNSLRKQITELLFAIPDDRIGWKRNAVAAGLELVERFKPKVVFATAPPFSTLLVGREIARLAGLPLVLDFRDPWTRVPWGPRNKSWLANRWVSRLERACVQDASAVVLNTPELEEDFIQHYQTLPRERFVSITNGFDPSIQTKVQSYLDEVTPTPVKSRELRLLHPGSLYRNRDPRPIVDAIALLKKRGITVILEQVGFTDPNFHLNDYARAQGIEDQIELHPAIPHDDMLRRMADADGFILLQPGTSLQVPGKLFEMILYQKPILSVCIPGALANIIKKFRIGTIAEAGDVESIADAISRIAEPSEPSQANWQDAAQAFHGQVLTRHLADVFNSVTNGRLSSSP